MTLQQPQLLRQATAADLPLIYRGEVWYMSHVEPESEEGWRRATDRHLEFWIANLPRTVVLEVASAPVGYAMWADVGGAATLVTIHVSPEQRGRGWGTLLLRWFTSDAAAAGYRTGKLGVHQRNGARALYERNGFRRVGSDAEYLLFEHDLPATADTDDAGPRRTDRGSDGRGTAAERQVVTTHSAPAGADLE
jgi:ribosomal-protein-alanine N-acetyltransferase